MLNIKIQVGKHELDMQKATKKTRILFGKTLKKIGEKLADEKPTKIIVKEEAK